VAVWHNFSSKIREKIDFLLLRNPNISCEMIWLCIYKQRLLSFYKLIL
jgi:hypothetical protein